MKDSAQHNVTKAFQADAAQEVIGEVKLEGTMQPPKKIYQLFAIHTRYANGELLDFLACHKSASFARLHMQRLSSGYRTIRPPAFVGAYSYLQMSVIPIIMERCEAMRSVAGNLRRAGLERFA